MPRYKLATFERSAGKPPTPSRSSVLDQRMPSLPRATCHLPHAPENRLIPNGSPRIVRVSMESHMRSPYSKRLLSFRVGVCEGTRVWSLHLCWPWVNLGITPCEFSVNAKPAFLVREVSMAGLKSLRFFIASLWIHCKLKNIN